MTKFFNRKGEPLELLEWAKLYGDSEYRQVALTVIGNRVVSTIWQGFDPRPSLVDTGSNYFETATWLLGEGGKRDLDTFVVKGTSPTEEDALLDHADEVEYYGG